MKKEELVPPEVSLEGISPPIHQSLETPPSPTAFDQLLGINTPNPVQHLRSSPRTSPFRFPTPPPSYEEATRTSHPALPTPACPNSPQSPNPPPSSSIPYRCPTPPPSTNLHNSFTFLDEKRQSPPPLIPLIRPPTSESPEPVVGYP